MPTLISISPDGAGCFIGVDDEGQVWRGEVERERSDREYIDWQSVRAEFHERRTRPPDAESWLVRGGDAVASGAHGGGVGDDRRWRGSAACEGAEAAAAVTGGFLR